MGLSDAHPFRVFNLNSGAIIVPQWVERLRLLDAYFAGAGLGRRIHNRPRTRRKRPGYLSAYLSDTVLLIFRLRVRAPMAFIGLASHTGIHFDTRLYSVLISNAPVHSQVIGAKIKHSEVILFSGSISI
jgi:hypothetical protein